MLTKEMQAALKADAEKLKQLTGEDHTPVFLDEVEAEPTRLQWVNCEVCGGSGEIIRRDPVGPYDDPSAAEYAEVCAACEGAGRDCVEG